MSMQSSWDRISYIRSLSALSISLDAKGVSYQLLVGKCILVRNVAHLSVEYGDNQLESIDAMIIRRVETVGR